MCIYINQFKTNVVKMLSLLKIFFKLGYLYYCTDVLTKLIKNNNSIRNMQINDFNVNKHNKNSKLRSF